MDAAPRFTNVVLPEARGVSWLLAFALACGGDVASGQDDLTVRDSAGLAIYESAGLGPRVPATHLLRLGAVDGPPATTFFRIADARIGADGTVYVLDGGDHVVKVFDRSGRSLGTIGGHGEGPAEFRAATNLELQGDTLVVLDRDARKLVRFDRHGALLATRRVGFSVSEHGFPIAFDSRPDGSLVYVGATGCGFPRRPGDATWGVFVFGRDGTLEETLARQAMPNALAIYTTGRVSSCTMVRWPFAPGPLLALDPAGGAYRSPADVFEIHRLDASLTRVAAIMRYPAPVRPISRGERQGFEDLLAEREMGDELRRAAEQAIDSLGYPAAWPAISALRVAGPGTVWARRGPEFGTDQEWDVLTAGRHVQTVVLPGALRVLDARDDRVVGVVTDELDVEYVAVFRVPR